MSRCHPEVYRSYAPNTQLRPWLCWCYHHEHAPNRGDSCRGILAQCPTWREALDLATGTQPRRSSLSRDKLLGEARAALTQLPDLDEELARILTERNHDMSGYQGKIVG